MSYKSVLITGANRGLGYEMVKQLLARKDGPEFVFAACRQPSSAQTLHELSSADNRLHLVKIDADDHLTFETAAQEVQNKLTGKSGLNVLINNAGILDPSRLSEITAESLAASFRINAIAPLLITKAFLPLLQSAARNTPGPMGSHKAAVVNISSGYASTGDGGTGAIPYRASKAALNNFTMSLSHELKPNGIAIISVCPGWVQTDMGGPSATITPQQSVSAIFKIVDNLSEEHSGKFLHRTGRTIPW